MSIRQLIGRNVKLIRAALALSQGNFALVAGISRASLINIESGTNGYNLNLLDKILLFSEFRLENLSKSDFTVPNNYREKLISHYRNEPTIFLILNKKPSIVYSIEHKLLGSSFFDTPKEIHQIKDFFEKLGWSFQGTSIQNALKRMPDKINIEDHDTKKNTFLYSKKKFKET